MSRTLTAFQKTLLTCAVISLSCLALLVSNHSAARGSNEQQNKPQIINRTTTLKKDLVSVTGKKILEIIEASYQTSENGIDRSSVRVRNRSDRNITAFGIIWTVNFIDTTKCQLTQIVDSRLHKDIVEAKGIRPFAPYEETLIPSSTNQSIGEGQQIESVGVEISFVEFEDSSGVGIEKSELYEQVISKRRGAEIYKQWIESDYIDNPQNMAKVIEKLKDDGLPNNKELENGWVEIGASIYRGWMRDILHNKGETLLREQIHRQLKKQK